MRWGCVRRKSVKGREKKHDCLPNPADETNSARLGRKQRKRRRSCLEDFRNFSPEEASPRSVSPSRYEKTSREFPSFLLELRRSTPLSRCFSHGVEYRRRQRRFHNGWISICVSLVSRLFAYYRLKASNSCKKRFRIETKTDGRTVSRDSSVCVCDVIIDRCLPSWERIERRFSNDKILREIPLPSHVERYLRIDEA